MQGARRSKARPRPAAGGAYRVRIADEDGGGCYGGDYVVARFADTADDSRMLLHVTTSPGHVRICFTNENGLGVLYDGPLPITKEAIMESFARLVEAALSGEAT